MKNKHLYSLTLIAFGMLAAAPATTAQPNDPPGPPDRSELEGLPADLAGKVAAHQELQQSLLAARKAFAQSLRNKTPAERRAAIEDFQDNHAADVAAHRSLGDEIRREMRELRGAEDRPERQRPDRAVANRPDRPQEVQDLTDRFRAEREQLLADKKALMEDFKDLTAEDRQAALEQWRAEKAEIIAKIREEARGHQQSVADNLEDRRNNR